jgi:hypothetical protein
LTKSFFQNMVSERVFPLSSPSPVSFVLLLYSYLLFLFFLFEISGLIVE